jgi:hypothetical protein
VEEVGVVGMGMGIVEKDLFITTFSDWPKAA